MPYDDDDDLDKTNLAVEAYKPQPRGNRAYLIALVGANVGEMFPIESDAFIGRSVEAHIRFADDGVSRKHALISTAGAEVRIEDLGSANGTLVNGQRVKNAILKDGDKIQIGSTIVLKFTYHDDLEESFHRQMYDAALRDHLTKAFNKKHFLERLAGEVAFAHRHNAPLALCMFDIDHFKRINDTYGHVAGDQVLARLAATVQATLRAEDTFARYGGEEFVALCRGTSAAMASVVAERIRQTVEQTAFVFEARTIAVTISIGVAVYPDGAVRDPSDLIALADRRLYDAKHAGRNRVRTA
jgi:two-component system cell cycle response regulator